MRSRNSKKTNDKFFENISFEDLVLHTALDMFEFSAHSFQGLGGPYFWNGIGIDFESPMPKEDVVEHAQGVLANTIYVAHTHPLSNDGSLKFSNATTDPRELIAFGHKALPLGNCPSVGDVSFLGEVKKEFSTKNINVIGVVFSATGLWEYDIKDTSKFKLHDFTKAYEAFYPLESEGFMEEWVARGNFPSYYMELQKPKMHTSSYKTKVMKEKAHLFMTPSYKNQLSKTLQFFTEQGITLNFYPYTDFDIDIQRLMRQTLINWASTFSH